MIGSVGCLGVFQQRERKTLCTTLFIQYVGCVSKIIKGQYVNIGGNCVFWISVTVLLFHYSRFVLFCFVFFFTVSPVCLLRRGVVALIGSLGCEVLYCWC